MNSKIKCILLDDEIPGLSYLKILCGQIPDLEVVKVFSEPEVLLRSAPTIDFDLCILDIEMPKISGMQVAQLLKDKLIIFTTAYKKYAADAFDVDAVDFVPKPVTRDRLQVAVEKAIRRKKTKNEQRQTVRVNTDKGHTLVDVATISYITTSNVDSRDKIAVMEDNSELVFKNISFDTLLSLLPEHAFCRVNKRQIIAVRIVSSFTFDEILTTVLKSGGALRIPLSETYRQCFHETIAGIS